MLGPPPTGLNDARRSGCYRDFTTRALPRSGFVLRPNAAAHVANDAARKRPFVSLMISAGGREANRSPEVTFLFTARAIAGEKRLSRRLAYGMKVRQLYAVRRSGRSAAPR
ncbi:hypothetical protein SAMN02799643_00977 [Methylobacterium sp. UNCCL125]|nr:hypothetical protein SAMN02799643_00977 [Methylobacterium sp. UNCCL125]